MKGILLGLAGLVMAFVLGRMLFFALASDETKIRWLVEQMEEGYDEGDLSDCVDPLHKNWRHEAYGLNRELLKGGLFQEFREGRDRETKERTSKVDVDMENLVIEVTDDAARLEVVATFSRQRKGEWEETWHMRVVAELQNGEDGWQILSSRHEDLRGTQLSR